jgi:enolase
MGSSSTIVSVTARQVFTRRGIPGVEATVRTQNGAKGTAVVNSGISVGTHEVKFVYDGGTKWRGMGVNVAIERIEQVVGPAIMGMDAAKQLEVDDTIIQLDGTPDKSKLGGNVTASVSAAVLKAGAASLGIPLYQHIGGVNVCVLPVPGVLTIIGSRRYGAGQGSGGKPSHSLMCYGFDSFAEASHAAWQVSNTFAGLLRRKLNIDIGFERMFLGPGLVKHDRELWEWMAQAIAQDGYEGKVGIQVDVAAATYYNKATDKFVGLFSAEGKTREDLIELYRDMVNNYPFVIIEDPLDEEDYEGHAILTKDLGIEIVGDDLFTTNVERVQHGIALGAANAVLLKVNQIGTISEAFDMVRLAYHHGYGVMPCDSRGEGVAIADYTVGLNAGHLREGALGEIGNRFLEIEAELGSRAQFAGRAGLKP